MDSEFRILRTSPSSDLPKSRFGRVLAVENGWRWIRPEAIPVHKQVGSEATTFRRGAAPSGMAAQMQRLARVRAGWSVVCADWAPVRAPHVQGRFLEGYADSLSADTPKFLTLTRPGCLARESSPKSSRRRIRSWQTFPFARPGSCDQGRPRRRVFDFFACPTLVGRRRCFTRGQRGFQIGSTSVRCNFQGAVGEFANRPSATWTNLSRRRPPEFDSTWTDHLRFSGTAWAAS